MKLYYLTTENHAISNIEKRRLKISRFSTLNDPFELMPVNLADPKHRTPIRNFKQQIDADKGLVCFSKCCENPVLWGHYGDKHKGIALGFEIQKDLVNSVIYSNDLINIPVDPVTNEARPDSKLVNNILRTKFKDWKYENEYRVFFELKDEASEDGLFFTNFSEQIKLCEVILGPNCSTNFSQIQSSLTGYKSEVKISKSRIAFKSFRVVRDLSIDIVTHKSD